MDKIWLKNYPPDVPSTVHVDRYHSVNEAFEEYCKQFKDNTAFTNFDVKVSYAELDKMSRDFAAYIQQKLALKKGDRFAIMLPNLLQFPIAMFGAMRAGLTIVNINPLYTARELAQQLGDSGAKAIIVLENFAAELADALPKTDIKHVIVAKMGDCLGWWKGPLANFLVKHVKRLVPSWKIPHAVMFNTVLATGESLPLARVVMNSDDIAFLQYTGGTTGVAKGAMLTHRNILANVAQCTAWVKSTLTIGKEVVLTALPLYHIFSLTVCCFCFMGLGSSCLLITNPRDLKALVKTLLKEPPTVFVGLNTLFNHLLQQPGFNNVNFFRFKLVIAGGMAIQKSVADEWYQKTKTIIVEGYGLTEASPVVTINPLTIDHYNGSIGLPVPDTEVKICDQQGREVAFNKLGELFVRGPQVMKGYWQRPDETELVLDQEGWLATGDIVRMDERGFIYVMDRKKDMILVSGFNVYPNEIEEVIAAHPDIHEVAVIGVPSDETGEAIKAFIVRRESSLNEHDILTYCRERLTGYKMPKSIEFREDLPKSHVGKVLRRELRED